MLQQSESESLGFHELNILESSFLDNPLSMVPKKNDKTNPEFTFK
jgi:hypothetical protein